MRIVCISDTHMRHGIEIPHGDILLHAGDATFRGYQHEVEEFAEWYIGQPHTHKVFVAGNHDTSFEDIGAEARSWLRSYDTESNYIIYLQDDSVELEVDGEKVKVYGSPWQPEFFNWAFNLPRGPAIKAKWDCIPKDTDILITHGPPYKLHDATQTGEHVGCRELKATIQRVRPKLHVCGHIHEGYGVSEWNGIYIANASVCNHRYNPVNPPLIFEYNNGILSPTSEI